MVRPIFFMSNSLLAGQTVFSPGEVPRRAPGESGERPVYRRLGGMSTVLVSNTRRTPGGDGSEQVVPESQRSAEEGSGADGPNPLGRLYNGHVA
jgi:hypothetical protein